ncbi:hypothetical protein [uncultured Limnobacter sp.]|uniref:hypothetical protein n=1 Tax=uncultured Limnobacter sp. TaxID=199681 RepID=UPI0030F9CA26
MKTHNNLLQWVRRHKILAVFAATLLVVGACKAAEMLTPAKEIALIIGEPWKDMQARSTAEIADDIPDEIWYRTPKELAYLRFADSEYGFKTPPAKFFMVGFNRGKIDSIRMSPQVEPLPFQEALDIVLDLQNQWRKSGWELDEPEEFPAYDDTPVWHEALKKCAALSTHWNAGKLYQLMVAIDCYEDSRYPDNKGYLVTISMGKYRE